MLTTNAKLDIRLHAATFLDRYAHQSAHAVRVNGDKRVLRKDTLFDVKRQEFAGIIARKAEGGLRQVIRAEGKEIRHRGNRIGSEGCARQFNHGANAIHHVIAAFGENLLRDAIHHGAGDFQFALGCNQGNHNLRHWGLMRLAADLSRRFKNRARLHFIDFREGNPQAAAAMPQHRVRFR